MVKKELMLNPDGTLNVLDPNKIYCLIATFPNNTKNNRVQLYINKQIEGRWYGFVRLTAIKDGDIITKQSPIAFKHEYLQYSIQRALECDASHYSKILLSFDHPEEFIAFCKERQQIFNLEIT